MGNITIVDKLVVDIPGLSVIDQTYVKFSGKYSPCPTWVDVDYESSN